MSDLDTAIAALPRKGDTVSVAGWAWDLGEFDAIGELLAIEGDLACVDVGVQAPAWVPLRACKRVEAA